MQIEQELESFSPVIEAAAPRRLKVIQPPSFSPSMLVTGFRELVWYRDLLWTLTVHRIRVRYKQSALGLGWAILQPLLLMLIYTVIFSLFTRVPSSGVPYPLFVLSALLPWTFFQTSLSSAASGLVSHTQLITKVYFPREILPLTYVFAALFDFLIACTILAVMMIIYRVTPTVTIFFAFPILLTAIMLASGLALILSSFQVRFRDIGIAMPLLLQLWMFGSPVVYQLNMVPQRYRAVYVLNPMVGIVENFRRVVVQGVGPDMHTLLLSVTFAVILLPCAYLVFRHREATMADII